MKNICKLQCPLEQTEILFVEICKNNTLVLPDLKTVNSGKEYIAVTQIVVQFNKVAVTSLYVRGAVIRKGNQAVKPTPDIHHFTTQLKLNKI